MTPNQSVISAAEFTRNDLGESGKNYPHIRALLEFAEAAIEQAKSAPAEPVSREVEIPDIAATFDGLYLVPIKPLNRGDHLMTVAQHSRIVAALTAQPLIDPALTNSQCACGDEYAANSYGAGFMAANNGVCENCDTYTAPPSPDAELVELLRDARSDLAAYIDEAYPQYMLEYPHNQRKHAADMEIVHRIDAKLASLKGEP